MTWFLLFLLAGLLFAWLVIRVARIPDSEWKPDEPVQQFHDPRNIGES